MKLDSIDKHIIEILQLNAKITNFQLAKEVGLSPAPTLERVKKLENSGYIKSYHAMIDPAKFGLGVGVFIQISLASHKKNGIKAFIEKIDKIPEVTECYHITGAGDFLLKVISKDITSYQQFILDKLVEIEEIGNMQSLVILASYKNSKVMPVEITG